MSASWTRDAMGAYVDWTRPPYQRKGSGIHHLVLSGEDIHNISVDQFSQRRSEYMRLTRRNGRKGRAT